MREVTQVKYYAIPLAILTYFKKYRPTEPRRRRRWQLRIKLFDQKNFSEYLGKKTIFLFVYPDRLLDSALWRRWKNNP